SRRAGLGEDSSIKAPKGAGRSQCGPGQSVPARGTRTDDCGQQWAELAEAHTSMTAANDLAVCRALEAAGVEFIDEDGGGPGVLLRQRLRPKTSPTARLPVDKT